MAGMCSTVEEEEEDFGPVIYRRRRRPLSVQPSKKPVRSWVVNDDDELIYKNPPPERSVFIKIDHPDVLDCPICLHPLFTPVFQCDNGHIACSSCCSKLNGKCPFCCTRIGINNDNRCRGLEKFIQSITRICCKYAKYGCKHTMPYTDKSNHEQFTCPHATCNCPHPSCSFADSYKNLYLHFHIQHAPSTTRFTCNTTFSLGLEINQKRVFLQEQHGNVIFILNHQVKEDGRAISIDYLGPPTSKSCYLYQLTAKSMKKTSVSLQSEPGIYTEWSSQRKNYLTVPSGFKGYSGVLSLSVCIRRKCISSEFEVEAEEETEEEVFGNEDNGALQVVLADPGVLDCSICHEPLCTLVFQCENGHVSCCSCCSKVETICPICYPLGYNNKYTRCRGLEVVIESIGKKISSSSSSSCINEEAYSSNIKSEHEQRCPPHSFQEDDDDADELIPIQDVELDSLTSSEDDELEMEGKNNNQQHTTTTSTTKNENEEGVEVVLDDPNILDCMICSNLLFPPVFQCEMGHLACSRCCSELKGICLCCMPINNKRCRGFEKFIESVSSISCKNAGSGCKKTVPYNNKSKHEQSCPHATCWCPYPSCSFVGSFKSLYFHFDINHTATRFTYGTTFSVCIEEIDQTTIFLQEQNENVIFILNHQVQEQERALNIDCVGVGCLKSCFVYQLTAKNTEEGCLLLRSVPEIYTRWSPTTKCCGNLTIPSGFAADGGRLSLSVCIIKKRVIPSEFEEEMKEVVSIDDEFNHHHNNLDGRPKVTLTNPDIFYCSICFTPLCRPVFQCEKGHLSCFSCCSKMNKKVCPFCYTSTGHCQGVENMLKSVIVPCKNDGCNMAMLLRYQNEHEQMCPHATCFCPYPSCPFTASHQNLYLHFRIKHEADITRFTYGATFSLCVGLNQDYLFLQEEEEEEASVIFILNHHQLQLHDERVIYIDCVGTTILWSKFVCQLTAKSMETSQTLECECVPEIFAKWSKHNTMPPLHEDYYLAVPSEFAGYNGLLSLSVCITKCI